jgi:hypothetical protein
MTPRKRNPGALAGASRAFLSQPRGFDNTHPAPRAQQARRLNRRPLGLPRGMPAGDATAIGLALGFPDLLSDFGRVCLVRLAGQRAPLTPCQRRLVAHFMAEVRRRSGRAAA